MRHGGRGGVPQARPESRASLHPRFPRERRHLLPAPRGLQQVLRRAARSGREVHGQDQREAGHQLPAVQLLRRARRGPRHHRHGLHLRRGRGSHRLHERPRGEGRPGQGPPVPPLRRRQAHRGHSRHRQEDRRPGPHQGARHRCHNNDCIFKTY